MKLYFVRHGESEANTQHVISNRESPFGLTDLGKQQANTLVYNLRDVPVTNFRRNHLLSVCSTQTFSSSTEVADGGHAGHLADLTRSTNAPPQDQGR